MDYEIGSVMTHEVFNYSQNGHIAVLTINRPEARNALNPEVLVKLATAWKRVRDDENIRVAVICGTGPAFCAGMDLGRMIPLITGARPPEDEWDEAVIADPSIGHRALLRDFDTEKPVIAAINGFAIAGGMELVMGCDLRVAADTAKFGLQEVKWAIFPGGGSTVRLPRQVPYSRAMEILLTGEQFTAERMLDYGFLNYVVPAQEVLDKAVELAEKIAGNGPLAVTAVRRSVREAIGVPEARALERESEISATVYATEDAREGPRAFMEKRKPVFKGR
jgi:enoyl-CoA hydratase